MYCTVGEVLEMIKDDMKNVIIGDEYIEDEQEREAKIATLCESAMDKLFDELFIHPFIGGGHRDEQNNNEQK